VLIVSTISPASQPIASQLETVFFQIFFVSLGAFTAAFAPKVKLISAIAGLARLGVGVPRSRHRARLALDV
jgi:hypothetical protein